MKELRSLLVAPHNDDETLFAGFLAARYRPHLIVVLRSQVQEDRGTGITAAMREDETRRACHQLGIPHYIQGTSLDSGPDWRRIRERLRLSVGGYDVVFAPEYEDGGHDQHNEVALMVQEAIHHVRDPRPRLIGYTTYRRGGLGRTTTGTRIDPTPEEVRRKLLALACYHTQIAEPSTRPWFVGGIDEWVHGDLPEIER